jgi:hypothetical protein
MAMNTSGPISLGGSTGGAGQSVNLQIGANATATISFNDAAVRTLTGTTAGTALVMPTNFYGKFAPFTMEYLVVAGGGSGGNFNNQNTGGGGGGGALTSSFTYSGSSPSSYTITVGGATSPSEMVGVASTTGGGTGRGGSGGSGGGADQDGGFGSGIPGQGYPGGPNQNGNSNGSSGGGGWLEQPSYVSGGQGLTSSITGASVIYAMGGSGTNNGSARSNPPGQGGYGSGGQGARFGGGGRQGGFAGVVIVAYPGTSALFTGGSVSTTSRTGYVVHTFTSSGTLTRI